MCSFRYSDDEDTSYKIRQSATKLLGALIATRPEPLTILYSDVSPALISRFGDRKEIVKLEIWATYGVLLQKTILHEGFVQANLTGTCSPIVGMKRSRAESDESEPATLLQLQVPAFLKALSRQLKSPKTKPHTFQAGFNLLNQFLTIFPRSLSSQWVKVGPNGAGTRYEKCPYPAQPLLSTNTL